MRDLPEPVLPDLAPGPASPAGNPSSPPPLASFLALGGTGVEPSVQGAVGPDHVVAATMDYVRILSRSGDPLRTVATTHLAAVDTIWSCVAITLTYDPYRKRFVAALALARYGKSAERRLRLLASQGPDPLGAWVARDVDTFKSLALNRPRLAVTADLLVLHATEGPKNWSDGYLYFLQADAVAGPGLAPQWMTNADQRMAPAFVPPGEPDRVEFLAWNPGADTATVRYSVDKASNVAKVTSIKQLQGATWNWSAVDKWAQSGSGAPLALDPYGGIGRGMVRGGLSWWAVPAGPVLGFAPRVAWFAVAESGHIVHQGVVGGDDGIARAYPSLAVTEGLSVLVGFVRVGAASSASGAYALRMAGDPAGKLRSDYLFSPGSGSFGSLGSCPQGCSLGPWSATELDPVRSDVVWTFQPVALAHTAFSTRPHTVAVAAVALPCGAVQCGACERCDNEKCVLMTDGAACFDGKPCTVADRCQSGVCVGQPKVCADNGPCFQTDGCDTATGGCRVSAANEGVACDDGSPCTVNDRCVGGSCFGTATSCPSPDACHDGWCNPATGKCAVRPSPAPACVPALPTLTEADKEGGCSAQAHGSSAAAWLALLAALGLRDWKIISRSLSHQDGAASRTFGPRAGDPRSKQTGPRND
ncbi:MAG: hypothetical protein FJ100_08485 [Deltaproteobacteria bacterium]|nr:hypothetical protein [Deltaproteobacteria bacterium]